MVEAGDTQIFVRGLTRFVAIDITLSLKARLIIAVEVSELIFTSHLIALSIHLTDRVFVGIACRRIGSTVGI